MFIIYLLAAIYGGKDDFNINLDSAKSQEFGQKLRQLIKQDGFSFAEIEKYILSAQELVLQGSSDFCEETPIDRYISSYFGKYTMNALDHILDLRLKNLELNNIKILQGIFIDSNRPSVTELAKSEM